MSKRRCVFLSCYLVDHKFLSWCEHDSKDRQIEKSECKKCDYFVLDGGELIGDIGELENDN